MTSTSVQAVECVLDKAAMAKAYGGSLHGVPATTVEPPTVNPVDGELRTCTRRTGQRRRPVQGPRRDEAVPVRHDSSGKCTDAACKGFIFLGRSTRRGRPWTRSSMSDLAKIGLQPKLRRSTRRRATRRSSTVNKLIPMSSVAGWGKDFADPYGFDFFILDSAGSGLHHGRELLPGGHHPCAWRRSAASSQYNAHASTGPMAVGRQGDQPVRDPVRGCTPELLRHEGGQARSCRRGSSRRGTGGTT